MSLRCLGLFMSFGVTTLASLVGQAPRFDEAHTRLVPEWNFVQTFALGDIDGDGDVDVLAVHRGVISIATNRTRHLSYALHPLLGQPLELTVEGPPTTGYGIVMSGGISHVPVPPLGILMLDPGDLQPLTAGFLDAHGRDRWEVDLPLLPQAAANVRVHLQALIGTSPPRLTNLETLDVRLP